MAHTLKDKNSVSITPSITGSDSRYVLGPPQNGAARMQGRYIWESGTGGSRTYHWLRDENIVGAAPTTYTATDSN